jgi:hypothetical protein
MKGYIIRIKNDCLVDHVNFMNKLLGRVVTIKRRGNKYPYYYPGALHSIQFYKISKAVYFFDITTEALENLTLDYGDVLTIIKADMDLTADEMYTGREYFLKLHAGKEVTNLG